MRIGIQFGGPDRASIKLLSEWPDGLCLSPLIVNPSEHLTNFLIKQYFETGAALFGRESPEEMEDVRSAVGEAFADLDIAEISRIVHYYVARVRNYAHVETMVQAEIWKAKVVASIPSPCEVHDGRVLSTADAASWVKWFRTLSAEEYALRVFGKDYGFPPFGLECVCRLEGVVPGLD